MKHHNKINVTQLRDEIGQWTITERILSFHSKDFLIVIYDRLYTHRLSCNQDIYLKVYHPGKKEKRKKEEEETQ